MSTENVEMQKNMVKLQILNLNQKNFIDFYHISKHNKIRHILEVLL